MISSFINFLSNNFTLSTNRKRRAEAILEDAPQVKFSRIERNSYAAELNIENNKENMDDKVPPVDDDVNVIGEVIRTPRVASRKTIHPPSRAQMMVNLGREAAGKTPVMKKANESKSKGGASSSVRPRSLAERVCSRFQPSTVTSSRQYKEMMQYRTLLAKFQQPSPFTIANIEPRKDRSISSPAVPVVDLTRDATISRLREEVPSTMATRAATTDDIQILKVVSPEKKPVMRSVNSLQDLINLAEVLDVSQIVKEHAAVTEEKKRLASIEETKLAILTPHNQTAINEALEDRIRKYIKITEPPILTVEEEEEEYILPTLTPEQEARIDAALKPHPPRDVLANKFSLQITRHDMATLSGLSWLNDEVINFFMNLLMDRGKMKDYPSVYAFNTFFYPKLLSGGHQGLKRWTRRVDIFEHDMVFVPVHLGMHWCMAVIDFREKQIRYYDSLGGANNNCLSALMSYLKAESLDKKKTEFDDSGWTLINMEDTPQQMNGSDCGMFACMTAEHLARDQALLFTQDNMPYFRRKMVLEILDGALLT